jgi:hypothetical protein
MDFTGNTGPNFRILRKVVNATSYLSGQRPSPAAPTATPSASGPDAPSDFGVRILGVAIGLAVGLTVGGAVAHVVTKARLTREDTSPVGTLQVEHVLSEDLL